MLGWQFNCHPITFSRGLSFTYGTPLAELSVKPAKLGPNPMNFRISRSSSAHRSCLRNRLYSSRNSSSEAFSPHGPSVGGTNFLCQARRLWTLTPTALAAAAKMYFSSTNRTASRLKSSPNQPDCRDTVDRGVNPGAFKSFIKNSLWGHYPAPARNPPVLGRRSFQQPPIEPGSVISKSPLSRQPILPRMHAGLGP